MLPDRDRSDSPTEPAKLSPLSAARVVEPRSGRVLEIETTEPGLVFYSGNYLTAEPPGREGEIYGPRSGFCLESQRLPNSPNQPGLALAVLHPGERYRSRTVYRFGVDA